MKIVEFKLIYSSGAAFLNDDIKDHIKMGYQPHGNAFSRTIPESDDLLDEQPRRSFIYQAMVKYEEGK